MERYGRQINNDPLLHMRELSGLPGEFYHGNDIERREDLRQICVEIITEKSYEVGK